MAARSSPSRYFRSNPSKRTKGPSHLISFRLSDDLLQRLAEVGNVEGLSLSDTLRLVLERGLQVGEEEEDL